MAVFTGTVQGAMNLSKEFVGIGTREVWLVTASHPAYTASAGQFLLQAVGAAIKARARDGKTRTIVSATCAFPGVDASGAAVYATSLTGGAPLASTAALNVSTDDIQGCLGLAAGTTATNFAASSGLGILVSADLT